VDNPNKYHRSRCESPISSRVVVEISYNIQAAVDNKHNLVVATHTINRNDLNALGAIALEAKENLGLDTFTVLVDKGYHNGRKCPMHK
jgi:hypothetical protein